MKNDRKGDAINESKKKDDSGNYIVYFIINNYLHKLASSENSL